MIKAIFLDFDGTISDAKAYKLEFVCIKYG